PGDGDSVGFFLDFGAQLGRRTQSVADVLAVLNIGNMADAVGQRCTQDCAMSRAFAGRHRGRATQTADMQTRVHAYISRPMAAATLRHMAMVSANLSGFRHWAPSLQAHCGLSCTSISRPSAPAATAATAMLWMYL